MSPSQRAPSDAPGADAQPRYDAEAERSVIGASILGEEAFREISKLITEEDFYVPAHAIVWAAITAIYDRGEPVDIITLADELRAKERLNTVGGVQFLGELTDHFMISEHALTHAAIVAGHSRVRRVRDLAKGLWLKANDYASTHDEILTYAEERLGEIQDSLAVDESVVAVASAIQDRAEEIERGKAKLVSYATRIPSLDWLSGGGLHPTHIWLVAARPSVGKTSLGLQVAVEVARGYPVLYFSLEQPRQEMIDKVICAEAQIDSRHLHRAKDDPEALGRLWEATQRLSSYQLFVDDAAEQTLSDIRAKVQTYKKRHGIVAVVIDYLQLMQVGKGDTRDQALAEVSRGLKVMARTLGVALVEIAQLNRKIEDRADPEPKLSDIRECGAFEGDADLIMILARMNNRMKDSVQSGSDGKTDEGVDLVNGYVLKNRHGPTGKIEMIFQRAYTRFREKEGGEAEAVATRASMRPPSPTAPSHDPEEHEDEDAEGF